MRRERPALAREAQRPQRFFDFLRQRRELFDVAGQAHPHDAESHATAEAAQAVEAQVEGEGLDDGGGEGVGDALGHFGGDGAEELEGEVDALGADPAQARGVQLAEVVLDGD